jgi:hypothetical protein
MHAGNVIYLYRPPARLLSAHTLGIRRRFYFAHLRSHKKSKQLPDMNDTSPAQESEAPTEEKVVLIPLSHCE